MTKLTDSQLILLSRASQRDDGLLKDAGSMNAGAASKVAGALIRKKLMREIRSKTEMPIWRQDEDGCNWSLAITKAGRKAIHIDETCEEEAASGKRSRTEAAQANHDDGNAIPNTAAGPVDKAANPAPAQSARSDADAATTRNTKLQLRTGTKLATIVEMLQGPDGASIASMMDATGWLPHTTRAALTGLRQRGFVIEKTQIKGEPTIYRLTAAQPDIEATAPDAAQPIAA